MGDSFLQAIFGELLNISFLEDFPLFQANRKVLFAQYK
jgi:hypothetical protein